jgi:hypothetical protein
VTQWMADLPHPDETLPVLTELHVAVKLRVATNPLPRWLRFQTLDGRLGLEVTSDKDFTLLSSGADCATAHQNAGPACVSESQHQT